MRKITISQPKRNFRLGILFSFSNPARVRLAISRLFLKPFQFVGIEILDFIAKAMAQMLTCLCTHSSIHPLLLLLVFQMIRLNSHSSEQICRGQIIICMAWPADSFMHIVNTMLQWQLSWTFLAFSRLPFRFWFYFRPSSWFFVGSIVLRWKGVFLILLRKSHQPHHYITSCSYDSHYRHHHHTTVGQPQ